MRERNRDKIFADFIDKLQEVTKGVISFETVAVDINQKVVHNSIDDMLLNTFNMFMDTNKVMLEEEKSRIQNIIEEYNALEIIRPVLADCIKPGYDIQATTKEIEKATVVDAKTAEELIKKYRIAKLLTLDTDTTELNIQFTELENKLKNMSAFVLKQYEEFK